MNRLQRHSWRTGVALLVGAVVAAPSSAPAQVRADTPTSSQPSLAIAPNLAGEPQLKSFAAMVGEPEALVFQRLSLRPDLMSVAMAAGEVRMDRKRSGKIMTITGFTILGVGVAGGLALVVSGVGANCSNDGCSSDDRRMQLGLLVAAVGSGVGLALGIPGIVRMSSQSALEDDAVARYRAASSSSVGSIGVVSGMSMSVRPPTMALSWPLLSFAF